MIRSFCARGNNESIKCGVHGTVGVLVGVCAVYNFTAWCFRRDRHLSINAVIYSLAVIWEFKHTLRHLEACAPARRELGQGADALAEAAPGAPMLTLVAERAA